MMRECFVLCLAVVSPVWWATSGEPVAVGPDVRASPAAPPHRTDGERHFEAPAHTPVTFRPPAPPVRVVDEGRWVWASDETGETVLVKLRVTEANNTYRWVYTVTNQSLSMCPPSPGIDQFSLKLPDASLVRNVSTSLTGWIGVIKSGAGGHSVVWDRGCCRPFLAVGETAKFTFETPPVAIVATTGSAGAADPTGSP